MRVFNEKDDESHAKLAMELMCGYDSPAPVYTRGVWYVYSHDKGVWEEFLISKVKQSILDIARHAEYTGKKGETRPIYITTGKLNAVYAMMEVICERPEFFENAESGICFKGGKAMLFRKTGTKVEPYSESFRLRSYFDFAYDGSAQCPGWLSFLEDVFKGDADKDEKIQVLQEYLGLALRGVTIGYQKVLMLLGNGRNGKSIFCHVVSKFFENSISSVEPQHMNNERSLVALDGARLNLVMDMSGRAFSDTSGWKRVTAGDLVTARRLYKETFSFEPDAAHIYSANSLPNTKDTSEGFFRRWIVVSFNRYFHDYEVVPADILIESLVKELPGIALWALKGSSMAMKRGGLLQPSSSGMIMEDWSASNNVVQQFAVQACDRCVDGQVWELTKKVFETYVEWCEFNKHFPVSSGLFFERLKKLGYQVKRDAGKDVVSLRVRPRDLWAHTSAASKERQDELRKN